MEKYTGQQQEWIASVHKNDKHVYKTGNNHQELS
jgi:hypothetical protein